MVGILTYHHAINYGAVLQAYALKTALDDLGAGGSVINYTNLKMQKEAKPFRISKASSAKDKLLTVFRFPMRAKTVRRFRRFGKEYLNLSGGLISTADELRALESKYDSFITGSDQVFNYNGTGEDYNYYLAFTDKKEKKIGYAPSFGLSEIDAAHRERISALLREFHALSVREEKGQEIVRDLLGEDAPMVCDPTFLLDKERWSALAVAPKIKKPYVLVYSFGSKHLEGIAKRFADEIGGIVVNINRALPTLGTRGVKNAYAPGPREFLGLIQNAECVVTNSFHGMALSILLEKEFYGFTNSYAGAAATNERFKTFDKVLGLGDRIFSPAKVPGRSPIDYRTVNEKISPFREASITYLKNALTKKENSKS